MTIGFMVSSTPYLDSKKPIGFMVSWFHGFVHSISGRREVERFRGFVVLWFRPLHLRDIGMTIGFMVLWFPCFMVSFTPSLRHRNDDRFYGFMVSSTRYLDSKKPINFMVLCFRPLHLLDIQITIGFMVSWFHGFVHSIYGTARSQ